MGETQRGILALGLESQSYPGRQLLLPETAVAGTLSATTQPNAVGVTGIHMHLHIIVKGNTATGTVQITGLKSDGTTVVDETSPTLAAATSTQSVQEYCTTGTYYSIDSSGIIITGLTNGTITVYGVMSSTHMYPSEFDTQEKMNLYSPKDHRGLMYAHSRIVQLDKSVTMDKFQSALYPESGTWLGYAGFSASPTVTTIPASPTSLLASTAVSGTPLSLTSQPTSPGMLLKLVVTGTATYGTITITGTNQYNQTAIETVKCLGGAGTFYTTTVFASVSSSGIAISGLDSGSLAVSGFFGTKWVHLLPSDDLIQTFCFGIFSGTETAVYPMGYFDDITIESDVRKEIKLTSKVGSQDMIILGDRSTSPMYLSRLPSLGQPIDYPIVGWQMLAYIDSITGTPFTTQYYDLEMFKLSISTGIKPTYTGQNTQVYSRLYKEGNTTEVKVEATVDFRNVQEYEKYRLNQKRILGLKLIGPYIGNSSGPLYKYLQFTLPLKWANTDRDRGKEKVEGKISGVCEYEASLGYAARLEMVNQAPPNWASL